MISRQPFQAAVLLLPAILLAVSCTPTDPGTAPERGPETRAPTRPNILWLTAEDMSPDLGCWGNEYATTPNIDRLASEGVRYTRVFATAPVCSPVRSCLITGVYSTTLGTQNLRSRFPVPEYMEGFPSYLRGAGYYCSNNVKTDYNTSRESEIIRASWDACNAKAHWRDREAGQPFFCVFNDMTTHQSRTMVWPYEQFQKEVQSQLAPEERHDPDSAPLPPYYPDTPITRKTVARYYDCITVMDRNVGKLLRELDEDGLSDDTIVFFYSDHGAGLPRHKRLLLDSGLHVPLIIRFPEKYRQLATAAPGETLERLVSFVDLPPTVVSLAGLPIPEYMQGRSFLGPKAQAPRDYIFGARDRVDEAYDLARCVRGGNLLYIRNYLPHVSYNQPSYYSDQGEIRGEITRLAEEGKLSGPQLHYAGPTRALEELYDTSADPHQIHNLADSPEHGAVLVKMRLALLEWMIETRDLGFLPEEELARRSEGTPPLEMASDAAKFPQERVIAAADLVGGGPEVLEIQLALLEDTDPAVRYWAAVGISAQGAGAAPAEERLLAALADESSCVRTEAAATLCRLGRTEQGLPVLERELEQPALRAALRAARALELLGETARPVLPAMKKILTEVSGQKGDPPMFLKFALEPAVRKLEG